MMQKTDENLDRLFPLYKMKNLCTVTSSKRIARSEYLDAGIPFYRSKEIILKSKGIEVNSEIHISKKRFNEIKEKFSVPSKGELLISAVGSIGFTYVVEDEEFYFKDGNLLWLKNLKEGLNSNFLKLTLDSDEMQRKIEDISAGSSQSALTIVKLNELELPIPEPIEQQKISDVISTVQEKIDLIDQKITQAQHLKIGLMQKLFSGGVGVQDEDNNWQNHTEFQNQFSSLTPKCWKSPKLQEVTSQSISYGIVQTGENIENGVPCVRVVDLSNDVLKPSMMITTSSKISNANTKSILKVGDILFALRGDIGKVIVVDETIAGCNLTRGLALIRPIAGINSKYLMWAIRCSYVREQILREVNGSALKEIPLKGLRGVEIPLPSQNEQNKIAEILSTMAEKLELLKQQKAETQQLKRGLMQKLLTGEWRVPSDENEAA